ncbi:hypothetical protein AAEU32_04990 [Pseudoalteromonas sp. SSDWG2]|uniref:hypothetical protein n=1 Tax=Pseudoalteromonas sp. SSDWG2 TaxID=3139391 RepID=UPI003BAB5EDE
MNKLLIAALLSLTFLFGCDKEQGDASKDEKAAVVQEPSQIAPDSAVDEGRNIIKKVEDVAVQTKKYQFNKTFFTSSSEVITHNSRVHDLAINQEAVVNGTITIILAGNTDTSMLANHPLIVSAVVKKLNPNVWQLAYENGTDLYKTMNQLSTIAAVEDIEIDVTYLSNSAAEF